jgi:hypothetical protein
MCVGGVGVYPLKVFSIRVFSRYVLIQHQKNLILDATTLSITVKRRHSAKRYSNKQKSLIFSITMLSLIALIAEICPIMLSVVMLSVVASDIDIAMQTRWLNHYNFSCTNNISIGKT